MSPSARSAARALWSFPRVSGDEPLAADKAEAREMFSPRERG